MGATRTTASAPSGRSRSWCSSRASVAGRLDPLSGAERAGDDHLLDLVGALADREDLRVAIEAAYGVLLDEPVSAVDLHGLLGTAHRQPTGLQLGLGGC